MKTITRFSKPLKVVTPATIIPQEEYNSLIETLEILNDNKILLKIESAIQNLRKGKSFTHKEVFGHNA